MSSVVCPKVRTLTSSLLPLSRSFSRSLAAAEFPPRCKPRLRLPMVLAFLASRSRSFAPSRVSLSVPTPSLLVNLLVSLVLLRAGACGPESWEAVDRLPSLLISRVLLLVSFLVAISARVFRTGRGFSVKFDTLPGPNISSEPGPVGCEVGVSSSTPLVKPSFSRLKKDGWLLKDKSDRSLPFPAVDEKGSLGKFSEGFRRPLRPTGSSGTVVGMPEGRKAGSLTDSIISCDCLNTALGRRFTPKPKVSAPIRSTR